MENKKLNISHLNAKILSNMVDDQLGLANGKMGICLYYYFLFEIEQNISYKEIADNILDDIINGLTSTEEINVVTGLAGIAVGIYLLCERRYIDGNINNILEKIDVKIFKAIIFDEIGFAH